MIAPSRVVRRPVLPPEPPRRPSGPRWLNWGEGLSKHEREAVKERIALVALSSVLAFAVLLVGGLLLWDKVIVPSRPVLVVDGHSVSLGQYTDVFTYRQNVLLAQLDQMQQLASQPPADPSRPDQMAQMARQQASQLQAQLGSLSTQLIEDLADDYLIRQEAQKRGLTATPAEIDTELKKLVGYQDPDAAATPAATGTAIPTPDPALAGDASATPAATAEATAVPTAAPTSTATARQRRNDTFQSRYRDFLRVTAGTDTVVRQDVETEILRRKLNEQLGASIPNHQEEVHARHILVSDEGAAKTVVERLNNGESFESLAAELSNDTSNKDKGGDLGWFPHGVMVSDFETAAFKLQAGQVGDPVKTSFGWHVIRVDERDASHEVDQPLLNSLKNGALQKWLESERSKHPISRQFDSGKQAWSLSNGRKPSAPSSAA